MTVPSWIRRRPKLAAAAALLVTGVTAAAVWIRGVVLYESPSETGTRTDWLAAADLPPALVNATIAVEDRRFRSHPGVDVLAIARAAAESRRGPDGRRWLDITQQVAKLLIDRRAARAPRARMLALRLEHRFDKNEILAMYLNLAACGNQTAGAARASRAYFGKPPSMSHARRGGVPGRPSAAYIGIQPIPPWRGRSETAAVRAPAHARDRSHHVRSTRRRARRDAHPRPDEGSFSRTALRLDGSRGWRR